MSHIKTIEEIITFILEKDGIHLKMEMDSSSGSNSSSSSNKTGPFIAFYFPLRKEHLIN